jgi:hypothetical protein
MTARDDVAALAATLTQFVADYDAMSVTLAQMSADYDALALELEECRAAHQPPPGPISGAVITTDTPTGWRETIREDFLMDCGEGQFAGIYTPRGIKHYPRPYKDTRWNQNRQNGQTIRGGEYSADFISVKDSICTQRMFVRNNIVQCSALVPVAVAGNGTWGDAPGMIYEHRSRFTYTDGLKSAHLLWPKTGTNTTGANPPPGGNGEIDYPEFQVAERVECYVHHQNATAGNDQKQMVPSTVHMDPREWRTYRLVWVMGVSVTIWCDGELVAWYTNRIPSSPMHLVLQNESWLDSRAIPADAHGTIETDWIRVLVPA